MNVRDQLERQCQIVGACEAIDVAAAELAALAGSPQLLDLWRLPIVVETATSLTELYADAFSAWADEAHRQDAILSRELRRMSAALRRMSTELVRPLEAARDFAQSESLDKALVRDNAENEAGLRSSHHPTIPV